MRFNIKCSICETERDKIDLDLVREVRVRLGGVPPNLRQTSITYHDQLVAEGRSLVLRNLRKIASPGIWNEWFEHGNHFSVIDLTGTVLSRISLVSRWVLSPILKRVICRVGLRGPCLVIECLVASCVLWRNRRVCSGVLGRSCVSICAVLLSIVPSSVLRGICRWKSGTISSAVLGDIRTVLRRHGSIRSAVCLILRCQS
jgi:hypothetical protein